MTAEFLPSRLPIIQAPMAGSQGVELCASVSEAGGLGSLPTAMLSPTELRDQIAAIRTRTHAPCQFSFRLAPRVAARPGQAHGCEDLFVGDNGCGSAMAARPWRRRDHRPGRRGR